MVTILWKIGNTKLTSNLFFMRYNQFTLVQWSINDTNDIAPERLGIWEGPQTLVWINKKENAEFELLKGNRIRWCLANQQTSQWKLSTFNLLNNKGNIFLTKVKDGCPKRRWYNHIWALFYENFSEKWESAIRSPLLELDPSMYKPSCSLACLIVLPMA